MANTKSAIKSIKKISRKTTINRSRKSRFKKAIKKMNLILEDKNKKEALKHYENSFNWIDIEKYYELWKNYLWECLSKLFFLNTSLYFEMQKDRLIYLENAKEWLDLINNIDISDEKYIGARNTKNIVNRSYSFIIKDYETERIYIDKMINDFVVKILEKYPPISD